MARVLLATDLSPAEIARRAAQLAPRLSAYLTLTPFVSFRAIGELVGADVLVKCEHQQQTGSFKARGALAKVLSLSDEQLRRVVVTASSGNHGAGVAYALSVVGGKGVVFVPRGASPVKIEAIARLGAEVRYEGTDSVEAEAAARAYAAENELPYVAPYNDPEVIAGQGTIGVEILDQAGGDGLDAVFVSVGGGGLISGVASVLAERLPGVRVFGASPANDAAMAASVEAGEIVAIDARPTLSDGTAGGIEAGAMTLALCRVLVDEWILVEEDEVRTALRLVIDTEQQLIEGAAAVAFAAAISRRDELEGMRVAVVSCGANISAATLSEALSPSIAGEDSRRSDAKPRRGTRGSGRG